MTKSVKAISEPCGSATIHIYDAIGCRDNLILLSQPRPLTIVACVGSCSEIFLDNTTRAFGNDSSVDWVAAGYQTSEHVIAILGSEDWSLLRITLYTCVELYVEFVCK